MIGVDKYFTHSLADHEHAGYRNYSLLLIMCDELSFVLCIVSAGKILQYKRNDMITISVKMLNLRSAWFLHNEYDN